MSVLATPTVAHRTVPRPRSGRDQVPEPTVVNRGRAGLLPLGQTGRESSRHRSAAQQAARSVHTAVLA
jgi:hypothetical protein